MTDEAAPESESPAPSSVGPGRSSLRKLNALVGGAEMSARRRVLESRIPPDTESSASLTREPDSLEPTHLTLGAPSSGAGVPSSLARAIPSVPAPGASRLEASNRRSPLPPRPEPLGPASPRLGAPISRWVGRDRPGQDRSTADAPRGAPTLSMSPRMTALFGGLFGLATVTTIIALLIQGAPPRDDRSAAHEVAGAPTAEGSSAPVAEQARLPKTRVRIKLPGPWRVADMAKDPAVRVVEDVMGRRSFIAALNEKGVPKDQTYRILKAFDGLKKFDKTGKNDRFVVAFDRETKQVRAFEYIVSPLEVLQAKETDGLLRAAQLDMMIAEQEVSGSFYVSKNLTRSMEWGGFEPDLARVIDDAFAGKISHESFEEGGTVRVIATEVTALGEFVRYKSVVAVEYRPPAPDAAPVRAYTYQGAATRGYFDEKGRQPDGSGWASPVPGAPVTSRFNPRRLHPVLKKIQPHNGTDYGASTGTPVYATYRGTVTHVGPAGACGLMVGIMHPNGIESGYCHLSKIAPDIKSGTTIGTRHVIGQVGTTGRSTGPHLHFWTKKDGKFFDSETLKIDGFRVIPVDERSAFTARKVELDGRLEGLELPEPPPKEAPSSAVAKAPADDTRPDVGAAPVAAEPTKSSAASKPSREEDPGDDLIGADLAH